MRRVVAVLFILFIAMGAVAAIGFYLVKDNATVSGRAIVSFVPGTIIQEIEFVDIQTGASTAFQFHQASGNAGNYSVTLKNGHTYNVYISFCVINPENSHTQFTETFHVNATDGQTVINKDFWD
jgi:VCBS repeat-containing protein